MAAASGGQIDLPLTVQSWLLGTVLMLIIVSSSVCRRHCGHALEHRRCTGRALSKLPPMRPIHPNLQSLAIAILVVIVLAIWMTVPVLIVIPGLLLIAWLLLTRGGKQALAITWTGLATLPQRLGSTLVIVVGIAGVVARIGRAARHGGRFRRHATAGRAR